MSYLGHGFQNRWLSDRFITTKSSSPVGRHRSICSMQIEPYQAARLNYVTWLKRLKGLFHWMILALRGTVILSNFSAKEKHCFWVILALKSTVLLGNFSAEKHCFTPGFYWAILALKSTVLLRPTERFLALKSTVLLSDYTAEKHYFAGPKWECHNVWKLIPLGSALE